MAVEAKNDGFAVMDQATAPRVLFLDIDGVLCTMRAHFAQGCPAPRGYMEALDREAVGLMNLLIKGVPGVQVAVVLMSTWRVMYARSFIVAHLQKYGFVGEFHDDWATPKLESTSGDQSKGLEVNAWLSSHPEVADWLIIDDRAILLPDQEARRVKPVYAEGFSWANFKEAAKLLHGIEGLPE